MFDCLSVMAMIGILLMFWLVVWADKKAARAENIQVWRNILSNAR